MVTTAFAGPIHTAAKTGDLAGVQAELDKGADVNAMASKGWTPLHYATQRGHKEVAELLIAAGADVNAKDEDGVTPLHDAVYEGYKEIAELLIANGADVNAKSRGRTPLLGAATKEIAELLIENGADLEAKNNVGWTPLHDATRSHPNHRTPSGVAYRCQGHKEIAELLLAKGADVNAKDRLDWTPLHEAAWEGHKEIAELLIAAGADVNAKTAETNNGSRSTPLDSAKVVSGLHSPEDKAAKKKVVELLRKHGGKTAEELALMPRLEYGKDRWPFGFSFTAKDGITYVVEVTQDFKQWGELETIEGTGKQVKFIDPRQPLVPFKRNS